MSVLTSWTFWIILGAIILIMALIGYLAEGTDFANKALEKKPKEKKEKPKKEKPVEEVNPGSLTNLNNEIPIATGVMGTEVVDVDKPIEVLNVTDDEVPSAWTNEVPVEDEHQETVVNVPTVDDWSKIPDTTDLPEVKLDSLEEAPVQSQEQAVEEPVMETTKIDSDVFPDITPNDLEFNNEVALEPEFDQAPTITEPEINSDGTEKTENKDNDDIWKV